MATVRVASGCYCKSWQRKREKKILGTQDLNGFCFPLPIFFLWFFQFSRSRKKGKLQNVLRGARIKNHADGTGRGLWRRIPAYNPCHAKGQNRFIRAVYGKGLLLSRSSVCLVIPILPPHLCFFYLVRACMRMFSFFPLVLIRYRLVDPWITNTSRFCLLYKIVLCLDSYIRQ